MVLEMLSQFDKSRFRNYLHATRHAAHYLSIQVDKDGYISAAKNYMWYKPHWLRDSSWIAISLLRYAAFAKENKMHERTSTEALNAASRIINFNIRALMHNMSKIKRYGEIGNPLPTRLGHDMEDAILFFSYLPYTIPYRVSGQMKAIRQFTTFSNVKTESNIFFKVNRLPIRMGEYAKGLSKYFISDQLAYAPQRIKYHANVLKHYVVPSKNKENVYSLAYHPPARIGHDYDIYRDYTINDLAMVTSNNARGEEINLFQHDSVPLILISLKEKAALFGLNKKETEFLRTNANDLLEYLGRIYDTPTANAWEIRGNRLHAYDTGAVYASFRAMEYFSENKMIGNSKEKIYKIENMTYEGGPAKFMNQFIRNGIIYGCKKPSKKDPEFDNGMDCAEIWLFSEFGIDKVVGKDITKATISQIDKTLFSGNMLPYRFPNDWYFTGGRWLLLGLSFADYFARMGRIERAKSIVDYVIDKYHGSYPEQELVNPANPGYKDPWFIKNGRKTIQDLAWSYAALIIACLSIVEHEPARKTK